MRGFIITAAMFIIMLGAIGANYVYVNRTTDEMLSISSEISAAPSDQNSESIEKLEKTFQESKLMLSISICTKDLENLSNCIDSVKSANMQSDESRLKIELELLKNAIEALARLERFGVDNIL